MKGWFELAMPALVVLLALAALGLVVARLYKRAEKDRAYVRTGLGGQKVILDGGGVVLPVFHGLTWVNLKTLRLEVRRSEADALITADRMRVDIGAEFYVRVKPDLESIALAAQTLGDKTDDGDRLRDLVEAKFVDALRSVAARMSLSNLQENRADFVQAVQTTVARDLESNGLELESASLTRLDQTDTRYFNPNNAFDAEGLTALTRITEARRKERNQVVRETEVEVAQQDLEARRRGLEIERQKQEAELSQQRDITNKTAATRAEAAEQEAAARLAEESARIQTEQVIAEREAAASRARETARIEAGLAVRQRQIDAERAGETLAISKRQAIEIADQDRAIAIAAKSREQSLARAEAEKARAMETTAEEGVATARDVARAEREKQIVVLAAQQEAEREATRVRVSAEAERAAAEDRAEALRTVARAEADAATIRAQAQSVEYDVRSEGERKLNEARNMLASHVMEFELVRERLRIVPLALAEAVKPAEKISDIRIFDLGGMAGSGPVQAGAGGEVAGPMAALSDALLRYRMNAPVVDRILAEAGFAGPDPVTALLSAAGRDPVPAAAANGNPPAA